MYKLYAEDILKACCKEEHLFTTFIDLCNLYGEDNIKIVEVEM